MEVEETGETKTSWSAQGETPSIICDHAGKKRKQDPAPETVIRILEDEEDDEEGEMISDHMKDSEEPSNKRVKPVAKSNSLTGVLTPVKTPALKRIGQSISVSVHKHTHTHPIHVQNDLSVHTFSHSTLFAAVYQFSHRGSTFAPGPAPSLEGLVIPTPAQQPMLE